MVGELEQSSAMSLYGITRYCQASGSHNLVAGREMYSAREPAEPHDILKDRALTMKFFYQFFQWSGGGARLCGRRTRTIHVIHPTYQALTKLFLLGTSALQDSSLLGHYL